MNETRARPGAYIRAEQLASRPEVAAFLRVPVATLEQWASKRIGPQYRIVGRHARYRWEDVDRWLAKQQTGGSQA